MRTIKKKKLVLDKVDPASLHTLFEYQQDGSLTWKIKPCNNVNIGDKAGRKSTSSDGKLRITIDGKDYRANHLVYALHNSYFPKQLWHINGNTLDTRIENLTTKKLK